MGFAEIMAAINMGKEALDAYRELKHTFSSEEQVEIEKGLQSLQAKNDSLFARLDAKLDEASKR
jgi:hypothetical protein